MYFSLCLKGNILAKWYQRYAISPRYVCTQHLFSPDLRISDNEVCDNCCLLGQRINIYLAEHSLERNFQRHCQVTSNQLILGLVNRIETIKYFILNVVSTSCLTFYCKNIRTQKIITILTMEYKRVYPCNNSISLLWLGNIFDDSTFT